MNKRGYNYCIHLLARRDYSRYKLHCKLSEKGYEDDDIEVILDKLIEQNYLREEEYKRIRVRTLINKGYSNYSVIQKCAQEKLIVDNYYIDTIRDQYEETEETQIKKLIDKKDRILADHPKRREKVIRYLISKGFQYQDIVKYLD